MPSLAGTTLHVQDEDTGIGLRTIHCADDLIAAEQRVAGLTAAPQGSDEVAKRVRLIDAFNSSRLKQETPATTGMTNPNRSLKKY